MPSRRRERHQNESASTALRASGGSSAGSNSSGSESGRETQQRRGSRAAERTDVSGQEHLEERRHQVVDALHVAACGVPNRPDVQYSLQALDAIRPLHDITQISDIPSVLWRASRGEHRVWSAARQSQSGAKSAGRAHRDFVRKRARPETGILNASERG